MNERAETGINGDRAEDDDDSNKRRITQPCCGHASDEADERTDREVEFVDRQDEHLGNRRQSDRNRQVQHQREAKIAYGARIEVGDGN